ncbi:mandelate racemase/muconate lactonizing enzyme family protein [Paralimibaculum aggregatum]|uniref:Mandelate racemase/muconate lactonizing enzyme family protein n=1 Tax=Paralimibaculum aggregatum TaxID=3036245 RepID=A0ABQ6LES0_9RHOB|nr:mandelate racemase/muconate lactonizing enzyme family protein [Limibaculum sp. NKW23]GMG81844.1 mandelate racemase/muconate lactonizing enzyme family protein [Limibaculum sp. NKW23]
MPETPSIAAIEISHHRLPLDPPFRASWDGRPRTAFDATIVRVRDSEGRVGIGSGDLMLGFAGHEGLFLGQDPRAHDRHYEVLSHIAFHYGRCWPLDLALWDLAGKIAGAPVWRLLGGASGRVKLYASSGVLRSPQALADRAEQALAEGFAAMKIRFSSAGEGRGGWRADIAALEAVRARIGDRMALMVDCNQGWRMPWDTAAPWGFKDALEVARALEPLGIFWMEEPLHRADIAGMAALRAASPIRIAGGEMTREAAAFRQIVEARALDILQPDAALTEGITGLARVARMARAAGLGFTPHSWTNGIGVLANAHLLAGTGADLWLEFPHDPPEWSLERRDFPMAAPLAAAAGTLELGEAPGFGLALDEARLAATRIG